MVRLIAAMSVTFVMLVFIINGVSSGVCVGDNCVPLPRVTVSVPVPAPTVTNIVPGPTVTKVLPRETVTVTVPGPTVTVTSIQDGQENTRRVTMEPEAVTTTVTSAPEKQVRKVETPGETRTVRLTVPQAVGLGLAVLIAGALLGLAGLFLAYYAGAKESEHRAAAALKKLRQELF